jgi:hypothetical protein
MYPSLLAGIERLVRRDDAVLARRQWIERESTLGIRDRTAANTRQHRVRLQRLILLTLVIRIDDYARDRFALGIQR